MTTLEVKSVNKTYTAWNKHISFTYKGEEYLVILRWDTWEGYDLVSFLDVKNNVVWIDTPEWAQNWDDNNEESLNYVLDELSDEELHGVRG